MKLDVCGFSHRQSASRAGELYEPRAGHAIVSLMRKCNLEVADGRVTLLTSLNEIRDCVAGAMSHRFGGRDGYFVFGPN